MKKFFATLMLTLMLTLILATPCLAEDTPSPTDTSNTSTSETGSYLIMGSGGTSSAGGQSITTDEFTGAATFNISLPVPPARGGVEPQLSLNYNSFNKNPNSWVGYGWELNVGMIERTPTNGHTDYYDGTNFQVNLNGQKETLTLVNANIDASSLYGITAPAGSEVDEYRAKIENAFNIYLHFRNTTDPLLTTDQGWVIIDKGGTRYYLGSTNQSRVQKSSHWVKQWLLDEVIDANGNTLQVTYDDEKYLETISYQDIEIEFYVSDLVNPGSYYPYYREPFYNADEQEHINKRLNTVNIKENGTTIQYFSFDYTYADKNNFRHLNTVEQCDGNPANPSSECLPETTFTYYEDAEAKWETTGNYNRQASTNKGSYVDGMVDYNTQFMDMNADGLVDKVVAIRGSDEVYVYYNNGNDFVYISGKSDWTDPFYPVACPDVDVDDAEMVCRGQLTSHHFYEGSSHQWQYLMDINGDNLPDRVRAIECTGCVDDTKQADLEVAFNTGNGWSTSTVVWRDPAIDEFPGMSDNGKFFMDFNGDGLLDRVVINKLEETGEGTIWADGFNVYYNNGTGFDQTGVFWQDPLHTEFGEDSLGRLNVTDGSGTKATIRDFNGDGLPDRMAVGSFQDGDGNDLGTGIHVYLNRNGLAWAQPEENGNVNEIDHLMIVDKASEDKGYINTTHDWIDMNNDGFLDRIEGDEENGTFTIFYFQGIEPTTGSDQLSNGETVSDPIVDGSDSCDKAGYVYNIRESNTNTRGFWLTHTMTADFNGDGYPDRLAISNCELNSNNKYYQFYPFNNNGITFSDSPTKWDYEKVSQPDGGLHSVSNGAGMSTVIEYIPSSWPRRWSSNNANLPITHRHLPFNLFLAHKIYSSDYTMNPNDENTFEEASRNPGMRWMTYEYRGGNFFVKTAVDSDGDGSPETNRFAEFNGFQSIEKAVHKSAGETWDDIVTTTYYHQALSDYDTISASDETYFQTLAYNHLALSGKPYYTETEVGGVLRSWQESDYTVDLVTTSDMFNCDGICFPRLTTLVKTFQESMVSPQKVSTVVFDYDDYGNIEDEIYYDNSNNEILTKSTSYYPRTAFAQDLQIRNRPEVQQKEQSGTVYRKKEFTYDNAGNPLEENSWITGSNYATVTRNYFTNGNLQTMTDIDSVSKSFAYDANGLFPTTESMTLPSGNTLTTTRDYNRILGKANEEIANTHVATRSEHDGFGRPVAEYIRSSSGAETQIKSYTYEYITADVEDWENITLLKTSVYELQPDYSDTSTNPMLITYSDASGFALQKCAYSEDAKYRVVYSRQENGGQIAYQSEPTRENDCTYSATIPASLAINTAIKDYQGRVIYQESPGGDVGSLVTTLSYSYDVLSNGYVKKTTTDGLGKEIQETYDYNERLVSVVDPMGNELEYEYNTVGDLERVTHNGQELVYLEYDKLGRKTLMRDANLGTWTYEYNANNQLYKQTDHIGNYSVNSYDSAGRLLTATYYQVGDVLEKTVTYSYDTGDADHTVSDGELYRVEEHDGAGTLLRTTRFSYESAYHRTEKITRTIEDVGDFEQTFTYNAQGQLLSTAYPGSQNLHYDYNRLGQLEQLCSAASCPVSGDIYFSIDAATGYDDQGKLLAETYGNGVVKNYSYYPNSHRMQGYTIAKNGTSYSERSYEYDAYSNLTKINDALSSTGTGGLSSVAYDTLSRLTNYQPQDGATAQSLTYDNQGNILTNSKDFSADSYQYNSSKPHAVTNIGSRAYTYDDNGNMLTDPERTMTYNTQNQLTRVEMTNGNIIDYAYDYTGGRVSKAVSRTDSYNHVIQSTTYYLGDAIEIRGETFHLNIFAGSQKVATKTLGTIDSILAPMGAGLRLNGIKPNLRVAVLMPYFMLCFILGIFLLMRPVTGRRSWYLVRLQNKRILSFAEKIIYYPAHVLYHSTRVYKSLARGFQETLFALPQNFAAKMVCFALVLLFSIQMPILEAHAGDSGVPPTPQSDDTSFYYVHGDHLGSAHLLTEGNSDGGKHHGLWYNSGDLIQRIEYNPFGTEKYVLNPNLNFSPEFTGQKYDIESGLYYYKSRYYNPKLARFIQADTVLPSATDYQSFNRYAYVRNNPLKYIDPSGHSFWGWFKKIAGAFIGAAVGIAVGITTGNAAFAAGASGYFASVIGGAVGGMAGGLVGGVISGGIQGAITGAFMGFLTGAIAGSLNYDLNTLFMYHEFGKGYTFGIMSGIGLSISAATDGWEGIVMFGVGLMGAFTGGKMKGVNIFNFKNPAIGGPSRKDKNFLEQEIIGKHLDGGTISEEFVSSECYEKRIELNKLSFDDAVTSNTIGKQKTLMQTIFNKKTILHWGFYGSAVFAIAGATGGLSYMGLPPGLVGFVAGGMLGFPAGVKVWVIGWSVAESGLIGFIPILGNIPPGTKMPQY